MAGPRTDAEREALFWLRVQKTPTCWLWTAGQTSYAPNGGKYGAFYYPGGTLAHRYSYLLAHPEGIPTGLNVCHHCDTPLCVRPDHLYAGNQERNMRDAAKRKRFGIRSGEANGHARLTAEQVREIRAEPGYYGIGAALGRKYGVTGRAIGLIRAGKLWKDVL